MKNGAGSTGSYDTNQGEGPDAISSVVLRPCLVAWAIAAQSTAASTGCDLNATTGNLASQVAAAQPGQTVCLASGSYGTFTGAAKSGRVTVEPAPGASVDMSVVFNGASNITVTGVTLDNATLEGATHDVTLSYSTVAQSGQIVVLPRPDECVEQPS